MNRCAECWVREPRWSTGANLGARVDGEPEPEHLCGAAKSRAQVVEAAGVGGADVEMGPLVQDLRVLRCMREKGS